MEYLFAAKELRRSIPFCERGGYEMEKVRETTPKVERFFQISLTNLHYVPHYILASGLVNSVHYRPLRVGTSFSMHG